MSKARARAEWRVITEEAGMTQTIHLPERTEAAEYYFTYINQVPSGNIVTVLETQSRETVAFLQAISDGDSLRRYASDKWSIRQVVSHINDAERVFSFRAFWFARGFDSPLPSFDQNSAISTVNVNQHPWHSHIAEFAAIRSATQALFAGLPDEAWSRRGVASGNPFTVRALAYTVAGHVAHHVRILRERYL
jgi:hypothetical protein